MNFVPEFGRNLSPLERKYLVELKRVPKRGELMGESISNLKSVLQARGWSRSSISGVEKETLVLKVLPYLDPINAVVDDEPFPLGSNCAIQFILRAIFLSLVLIFLHSFLGLSVVANTALYASEVLIITIRNIYLRFKKREKLRKLI
mmetsp:Transcript_23409/g.30393  ORF Transcript_23409/g.30393 Transcript_23409/m.30393 type:complete len:147 (-) Transcript_23409:378-818(-)